MNQIEASKIKIAFFTNHGPDAMAVLRLLGPAQMLGIEVALGYQNGEIDITKIHDCDLFVHQRDFCKDFQAYRTMYSFAQENKIPVVFDLDDLFFELPENHPDRISGYFTEALLPMLQAVMDANMVSVSTQNLADYLLPYNPTIQMIPNYLNDEIWLQDESLIANKQDDDIVTIGYMGGHSHQPDLDLIVPVLKKLAEKYDKKIRFKFIGIQAPHELEAISETLWIHAEAYVYTKFAEFFKNQEFDFAIAPLEENLFNTCKSGIKYLEYSAIGVPAIYSAIPPYTNYIQNGFNGLLANSKDEWLDSLVTLIENPDLRNKLAKNAKKDIVENWLLSKNINVFSEFYQRMLKIELPQKTPPIWIRKLIAIFNQQYFETFANYKEAISQQSLNSKNKIEALNQQLQTTMAERSESQTKLKQIEQEKDILKDSLDRTEYELISLHLSKSWQLTRPIRKFNRLINKRLSK